MGSIGLRNRYFKGVYSEGMLVLRSCIQQRNVHTHPHLQLAALIFSSSAAQAHHSVPTPAFADGHASSQCDTRIKVEDALEGPDTVLENR